MLPITKFRVIFFSSGKTNKLRVYYLSWLKNKIVKGDEVQYGVNVDRKMYEIFMLGYYPKISLMFIHRQKKVNCEGMLQWGSLKVVHITKLVRKC